MLSINHFKKISKILCNMVRFYLTPIAQTVHNFLRYTVFKHYFIYKLHNRCELNFKKSCNTYLVAVFLPESFPFYMESLQAMDLNTWIITVGKFCVAFPFSYHFLNGIRHLVWDVGYLWTPKQVDVSGYVLVLCAIALAVHLVLY